MEPGSSPARAGLPERGRLGRALGAVFGMAGIAFLALAFRETWDRRGGSVLPGWPELLGAFALAVAGLLAAERGWRALVPDGRPGALARAFYTAQLGKYIPGGVWQAAGQIGMTAHAGVGMARAAVAFPVHALGQVAAGGALGALLALTATDLDAWKRAATLGGLSVVVLLRRGWMVAALRVARRSAAPGLVPAQRGILIASAWSVVTLLASGLAFWLLARGTEAAASVAVLVPGFALAWAAGFLALPFPSGIGVREAVLIAVGGPAAPVIAVSVAHRLVTIAAEAVMVVAARARRPVDRGG